MVMTVVGLGIILDSIFLLLLVYIRSDILSTNVFSTQRGIIILGSIAFFFVLGFILTFSGLRAMRRFRAILRSSIRMLLDKRYIDIRELSRTYRIGEMQIMQNVEKAKRDGYLPLDVEIKLVGSLPL
jgi:hypothetical protein